MAGFITSKAIAVFIGAEGLALIGNLRNFLTTIQSFSTLGFSNGIVKYVSEFKEDKPKLNEAVGTVLTIVLITALVISLLCYFNADAISSWIFGSEASYGFIIKILAFTLPFSAGNLALIAIINGLSKYKTFVSINIYSQVLGLLVTLFFIWKAQLEGALIAAVTVPGVLFFVTLFSYFEIRHVFKLVKLSGVKFNVVKNFSAFSIMALFSAAIKPLVFVFIRNYLIDNVSMTDAGFWEAITRISNYYLMFVSTLLALYILPRFSEITNAFDFRKEIIQFYKTVIPIFGIALVCIYFLRSFIVYVLFTEEFRPVEDLFMWQLLGDFLKVISLVIAYQLIAKRMVVFYIGIELFSIVTLYLASIYLIDNYGVEGAVIAHFVNFAIHTVVIVFVFRKLLFSKQNFEI